MKHLLTVPAAVVDDPAVGPHALRLLLILSDYANRDGWAWPSLATLGRRLGVAAKSTVHQHLAHLCKLGYVKKGKQALSTGVEVTAYRVVYDRNPRARRARVDGGDSVWKDGEFSTASRSARPNGRSVSPDGAVRPGRTMERLTTEQGAAARSGAAKGPRAPRAAGGAQGFDRAAQAVRLREVLVEALGPPPGAKAGPSKGRERRG